MKVQGRPIAPGASKGRGERGRPSQPSDRVRASAFLAALQAAERQAESEEEIPSLERVDRAGERLRENPTPARLEEYKREVAAVLRALTQRAFRVVTEKGAVRAGRQKIFVLVRAVNEELEALTRLVLAREKDRLAIVAKLDQVRGLLVDLYR